MKIVGKDTINRVTYTIADVKKYDMLTYIEYVDHKDRVVYEEMLDENGYVIHDDEVLKQIQELVDNDVKE